MYPECPLSRCLDKRYLVDLFQCRQPAPYAVNRRFTQKRHSFFLRQLPDLAARLLFQNHLADWIGQIQQFVDSCPSPVTCAAAFDASGAFTKIELAPFLKVKSG